MSNYNPTRRTLLQSAGAGFGYLALSGLIGQAAAKTISKPLSPKQPHFAPKAKRVIFLFMEGAMSSLDTVEYKPELNRSAGKSGPDGGTITPSKFQYKQYGNTGSWFSELLPNIATHADELCWIRGLHTDTPAHPQAVVQLHSGSAFAVPAAYSFGNAGRTFGEGPGAINLDTSVLKDFRIRERTVLQFRVEALNFLNHANFGNPDTRQGSATFGQITTLVPGNQSRILQLGLHLKF